MQGILSLSFIYIFFTFITSFAITCLLLKEKIFKKKYVFDDNNEDRKIHEGNVKRIGGLSISITTFFYFYLNYNFNNNVINYEVLIIFLYSLLFFLTGFLEDLLKNINPFIRLTVLLIVTFLCLIHTNNIILKTEIDFLDYLFGIKVIAIFVTAICVVASANSFNMMDGANGLITIFTLIILTTINFYAFNEGNKEILVTTSIFIGALFGFLFLNWPKSQIFLGDGGSYLIGSFTCLYLIFIGNKLETFNFLNTIILMSYPVWEILFTFLRRLKYQNKVIVADNFHLLHLIYKNLKNNTILKLNQTECNAITSILINIIALLGPIIFLFFQYGKEINDQLTLFFFLLFLLIYSFIYIILSILDKKK